ncbi:MAG: hypothetical protein KU38_02015 [Sulfurovum sp. FS08-3]|nr:MAG: hypothetical protein KU38_02015 [Sulfurovum sp. FS08-3]
MQNVTISIEESAVDKVMYLLRNLSDIKILSSSATIENQEEDLSFVEEKKRLQQSKRDMESGTVKLLLEKEADNQIEAFLSHL